MHAVPLTWVLLQDALPRAIREGFPQHLSPLTIPTGDIPLRFHDCFFHYLISWFLFFGFIYFYTASYSAAKTSFKLEAALPGLSLPNAGITAHANRPGDGCF